MRSLRGRLFVILVAATGVIWFCGFAWIFVGAKARLEQALDTRLQEAARMVNSLVESAGTAIAGKVGGQVGPVTYEHQLSCQIWALDGRLLARSGGAPEVRLTDQSSGFSDRIINGEAWRVYSIENASTGVRVMIGDRLGLRERLVVELVKGLMIPALVVIPLLGLLIWASLGRGLKPLTGMAGELRARGAEDMSPVDALHAPSEVRPLADALNGLFVKVEAARRHEREVTAFAAHELRTPLAGLKTQAQIALAANDPAVRQSALGQILVSVDRATRLVRQLLALAKLDSGLAPDRPEDVNVGKALDEVVAAPRPEAGAARVVVDPALRDLTVRADRETLGMVLANLHENAVQHTPRGGVVTWKASPGGKVVLEDEGPGIPEEELPQVTGRFFRGKHRSATGCGLGLAIVEAALRRIGAGLVLENREDAGGLRATLAFGAPGVPACPQRPGDDPPGP